MQPESGRPAKGSARTVSVSPARARLRRARWLARSARDRVLEEWPAAYCWFQSMLADTRPVTRSTQLVIEGYMGSGNSFAREAFVLANPAVGVASHRHSTAQLLRAQSLGVPILFLVRDPIDAIPSYVARHEVLRLGQELRRYQRLYEVILDMIDTGTVVALALFDEVVSDFGGVTHRVNAVFDTQFVAFGNSPDDVRTVRAVMDSYNRSVFGDDYGMRGALPDEGRRARIAVLKEELRRHPHAQWLARCEGLYDRLTSKL